MSRAAWLELGAVLSVSALWLGIFAAFLIDGMDWAAAVGTIPTWAYLGAIRITHRKAPRITDPTREWFI